MAFFMTNRKGRTMKSIHFGISSGKHGQAADHLAYITRQGCHADRNDLILTGFGNMPAWAKDDPSKLWKASDKYERKNGSIFRSFRVSLPNVLTIEQLEELAWKQATRIAGNKPFQFALHMHASSLEGELNPHIHVVVCDRLPDGIERPAEQMFSRYNSTHPEKGGCPKDSGGRTAIELRGQVITQRKEAVETNNEALEDYGHDIRFDHRTLRERGIDRKPERYLGPARIRGMSARERSEYIEQKRGKPKAFE